MSKKKILFLPVLLFGIAIVFSGCGGNNSSNGKRDLKDTNPQGPPKAVENKQPSRSADDTSGNLPAPTGKVDDTVNAALEAANSEKTEISQDESEALSSIDDSEETNDFGQSYDENEF